LDRSNQPLVGATITLTDALGAAAGSSNTRDQGRWSLAVPQGDYDLEVTAQQDGHTLAAKVRHYTVGADTKLNLVLAGDPAAGGVRAASAADGSPEADGSTFTRAAAAVTPSSSGMVTFSGEVLDADGHLAQPAADVLLSGRHGRR
jgi:hypothetical protein